MADKTPDYVQRSDISRPGQVRRAGPAPKPSWTDSPMTVMRALFPQATGAAANAQRDAGAANARGDVAGTVGAAARQIVTVPLGALGDVVGRPIVAASKFGGGVLAGALGLKAAPTMAATADAPAEVAAPPQDLSRVVTPERITPQDRQMALIDAILQQPNTLRQATTAVGMLPAPHYQSQKDISGGQSDQLNTGMLNAQLADIAAQKKAGTIDDKQAQEGAEKATNAFFQRRAMTWGFNPLNNAIANQFEQQNPGG